MTRKTQPASETSTATGAATPGEEPSTSRRAHPTEEFYMAHEVHTLVQLTLQRLGASWNGSPTPWATPLNDFQATSMPVPGPGMGWPANGMFPGAPQYGGVPQPVIYWYP